METAATTATWTGTSWGPAAAEEPLEPRPHKDSIEALGRGLRVIEAFEDGHNRMSASEAALAAGISRAAARRYLLSLCSFGYAETDGRHFWLAPRVLRLGQSFLSGGRLPRLVQPYLDRLAIASGESASMSVLDEHEIVYLASSRSARLASVGHAQGARLPAHAVAAGYAVLSTRTREQVHAWTAAHEFTVFTPHTPTGPDTFCRQVDRVRHLGYAWVEGQHHLGLKGLAVPLADRRGQCFGALALTLQAVGPEAIDSFVPLLMEARESLCRIV
jgi:IclR family transcriptional regulator, pca regulon regulatory protein